MISHDQSRYWRQTSICLCHNTDSNFEFKKTEHIKAHTTNVLNNIIICFSLFTYGFAGFFDNRKHEKKNETNVDAFSRHGAMADWSCRIQQMIFVLKLVVLSMRQKLGIDNNRKWRYRYWAKFLIDRYQLEIKLSN